jgi:PhnB protein
MGRRVIAGCRHSGPPYERRQIVVVSASPDSDDGGENRWRLVVRYIDVAAAAAALLSCGECEGCSRTRNAMTRRPERYQNAIVPHIYVDGASDAIAFYKRAFGATELFRIAYPSGRILHAELAICDSVIMIGDPDDRLYGEPRAVGRCTASLHIFLDDNVALLRRAVEAGAEEIQRPTDLFYGANSASLRDPFGHVWVLLSWNQDLAPAEMERRGNALLSR